jgi:CBS domain-containing protein/anti-sigma regulatory factor (Ser/Thr protein kinase)
MNYTTNPMSDANPSNKPNISEETAQEITRVEELAYVLRVSEVMTSRIKTVNPAMRMGDVLELLRQERISGAPVVLEGDQVNGAVSPPTLIGVVSLEDLIKAMTVNDLQAPVSRYMSKSIIYAHSYDPVVEALKTFTKYNVGRLPVVDEQGALVGMITKGDITRGVLNALQKDFKVEEVRRYRASHLFEDIVSDRTSLILRYHIRKGDFTRGGNASSNIKRALLRLGASPLIARRCGIAIYEAEMNLIIHTTEGGIIRVEIEPHKITMRATDEGPGIQDVELAKQAGYSTATEEVREMGFGAGMGLFNINRCVDKMILESEPGKGTHLEMKIYLQPEESVGETGYHYGDNPV